MCKTLKVKSAYFQGVKKKLLWVLWSQKTQKTPNFLYKILDCQYSYIYVYKHTNAPHTYLLFFEYWKTANLPYINIQISLFLLF